MRIAVFTVFIGLVCLGSAFRLPGVNPVVETELEKSLGPLLEKVKTEALKHIKEFFEKHGIPLEILEKIVGKDNLSEEEIVYHTKRVAEDFQTAVGKLLSGLLNGQVQKLKDLIAQGQEKYEKLLEKGQALVDQIKNHAQVSIEAVKSFIQEAITAIISGIVPSDAVDDIFDNMDHDLMVEFEKRGLIDMIKDSWKQIINHFSSKFADLKNFFLQLIKDTHEQVKPHIENIKDLAKQFIDHAGGASDKVKEEALKFFQQYKNDLGNLWQQIVDHAKDLHGQITGPKMIRAVEDDMSEYFISLQKLVDFLKQFSGPALEKVKDLIKQHGLKWVISQLGKRDLTEIEKERVTRAFETTIVKLISEKLQQYVQKLSEIVAGGKQKYEAILAKAKVLLAALKDHKNGAVQKIKEFIDNIKNIVVPNHKRSLMNEIDQLTAEFEQDLLDEFEKRGIIDSLKDKLAQIVGHLKGKFSELKEFFKQLIKDTHGQLKPHIENIKDLAKQFIDHAGNASDKVKEEALKFFQQYKNDLGNLWQQIKDLTKDLHGQITPRDVNEEEIDAYFNLLDWLKDKISLSKLKDLIKEHGLNAIKNILISKGIAAVIALGKRDVEEQAMIEDMQTAIGNILEGMLGKYVDKLKELVQHGKNQYAAILVKAKALVAQLKDHTTGAVEAAKQFLQNVLATLVPSHKRAVADHIEVLFDNFAEEFMAEVERRSIIGDLKDKLSQIINHFKGKFADLKEFFKQLLKDTHEQLKPHIANIKDLAQQFIDHAGGASDKVKEEALKFFQQYKNDLGNLWQQIVDHAKDLHGQVVGKRSVEDDMEAYFLESITDLLKGLVGDALQQALKVLKEKGLQALKDLIAQGLLGKREVESDQAIDAANEELAAYFLDLSSILEPFKQLGQQALKQVIEMIKQKGLQWVKDNLGKILGQVGKRDIATVEDMQTVMGNYLKEKLQKVVQVLSEKIAQGKVKYQALLEKAKALLEALKGHSAGIIEKIKNFLISMVKPGYKAIMIREVDETLDQLEAEFFEELERRSIIAGIKDKISQIINHFKGKFAELREFFKQLITDTHEQLKPHIANIKDLAQQFIDHAGGASDKVKEEALKFFQQYKNDLGNLWQQVVDHAKDLHGQVVGKRSVEEQEITAYFKYMEILKELAQKGFKGIQKIKEIMIQKMKDLLGKLGKRDAQLENDMSTVIGSILEGKLTDVINKLKELIAHGKTKYQQILVHAKTLMDALHGHATGAVSKVVAFIKEAAKLITGIGSDNEIEFDFQEEFLKELERRSLIGDLKDKISQIINHFTGKFAELKEFFKQLLTDTHNQLKPHIENIKDLAKQFIDHANGASDKVKEEALKFFQQYKNDLGNLWQQVVDHAKDLHGQVVGF